MPEIKIDKLYRNEHKSEPVFIGFPLPKGKLADPSLAGVYSKDMRLPSQAKATARYEDGSVKFLFLRFLVDTPANKAMSVECDLEGKRSGTPVEYHPVSVSSLSEGLRIETGDDRGETFSLELRNGSDRIIEKVIANGTTYAKERFTGPMLREKGQSGAYDLKIEDWQIVEDGPVCAIVKTKGVHTAKDTSKNLQFELRITVWAGKPWAEVSYRIINTDNSPLAVKSLHFDIAEEGSSRCCIANSNYLTSYLHSENGEPIRKLIDADWLINEANEHFAEVFHGTFFADCTGESDGICATVYQAHQNFPKALEASKDGIRILLVPEEGGDVVLQSGMAREQKFLLHFHSTEESLEALNDRSIVYQMPNRPYVSPEVHKESGVWPNIFPKTTDYRVEQNLIARADGHSRSYGMLNFGDSYDANYTAQGRGNGRLVWSNNEYDYPHACALLFARTGIRRFLDYVIASASHWMDVDVCHYHTDPMYVGGQWEHTAGHVINGVMVCSHQWVEGLLDYYHFTGDERGLETAIGIGKCIQRLLDTPAYAKVGESNARETGWALRTLTALYAETLDESWCEKCERIINDFKVWEETYGHWMAPYTDNTLIRVGFMISVAIGSIMRYYRYFPREDIKQMVLRQVDDLIENCYVKEWGIFYYKELPSLNRLGNNTMLLEALYSAYDLSRDKKYLEYGIETFKNAMDDQPGYTSLKTKREDAVLVGNVSSKNYAQSMIPLAGYWRALSESEMMYR